MFKTPSSSTLQHHKARLLVNPWPGALPFYQTFVTHRGSPHSACCDLGGPAGDPCGRPELPWGQEGTKGALS